MLRAPENRGAGRRWSLILTYDSLSLSLCPSPRPCHFGTRWNITVILTTLLGGANQLNGDRLILDETTPSSSSYFDLLPVRVVRLF